MKLTAIRAIHMKKKKQVNLRLKFCCCRSKLASSKAFIAAVHCCAAATVKPVAVPLLFMASCTASGTGSQKKTCLQIVYFNCSTRCGFDNFPALRLRFATVLVSWELQGPICFEAPCPANGQLAKANIFLVKNSRASNCWSESLR